MDARSTDVGHGKRKIGSVIVEDKVVGPFRFQCETTAQQVEVAAEKGSVIPVELQENRFPVGVRIRRRARPQIDLKPAQGNGAVAGEGHVLLHAVPSRYDCEPVLGIDAEPESAGDDQRSARRGKLRHGLDPPTGSQSQKAFPFVYAAARIPQDRIPERGVDDSVLEIFTDGCG